MQTAIRDTMYKKIIIVVLAVILGIFLLVGCGPDGRTEEGTSAVDSLVEESSSSESAGWEEDTADNDESFLDSDDAQDFVVELEEDEVFDIS